MPLIGPLELGIVAFIIVLIFGVGKLPELSEALGNASCGRCSLWLVEVSKECWLG